MRDCNPLGFLAYEGSSPSVSTIFKGNKMNKPLVVGYKGEIGSFILNGLLRVMPKALDIWCVDINETEEETEERIKVSDVIFICVPMEKTLDWIKKHKSLLEGKILIEQCSLKELICNDERIKDLNVKSMHILFRPSGTPLKEDRRLALFDGQFDEETTRQLLDITDSNLVTYSDAEEHDKEMAIQQALVHRTILLLGEELGNCKGSTYVSKKIVELANRVKKGNVGLYQAIQDNRHLDEGLGRFLKGFDGFELKKHF